ncbi:MAG: large conductance mechanosensitive channel protein MscL [Myxococcaceae bacterium]
MWQEFKEFVGRSNVLGLAVALVLGAAFGAVVVSFTDDILMQVIAAIGAKPDFSNLAFTLNGTPIRYGSFLTAVLSFLIVGFAMFLVVKGANRLQRKQAPEAPKDTEVDQLRQIRDTLRTSGPTRV